MDGSLYIRIRGRIQGPFEEEKLRSLVKRGQLSRMHQLSTDGTNWQRADEFPELFNVTISRSSANIMSSPDGADAATSVGENTSTSHKVEPEWHYAIGDQEFGPVDWATLQGLVKAGQLGPTSQVWKEGMHRWATAESIAGLLPDEGSGESLPPVIDTSAKPRSTGNLERKQGATDYSRDIVRSLSDARGWVLFIACSGFTIATLHLVFGLLEIAVGLSKHLTPLVSVGLMNLLSAGIIFTGATYLFNYNRHVSGFVTHHNERHLDAAMRTLKQFWTYTGIILIVLLVIGVGVAVWVAPMVWEASSAF